MKTKYFVSLLLIAMSALTSGCITSDRDAYGNRHFSTNPFDSDGIYQNSGSSSQAAPVYYGQQCQAVGVGYSYGGCYNSSYGYGGGNSGYCSSQNYGKVTGTVGPNGPCFRGYGSAGNGYPGTPRR
jgi:hypothetical protein